jgi:hypothetical protein
VTDYEIVANEEAVRELIQIAEMFERHREGVCNALCNEQSSARAEQIDGKIQEVKTVGREYRKSRTSEPQSSFSMEA